MAYTRNCQVPNENIDHLILNGQFATVDGYVVFFDYLEETKKSEDMLSKEMNTSVLTTGNTIEYSLNEKWTNIAVISKASELQRSMIKMQGEDYTEQVKMVDGKENLLKLYFSDKQVKVSTEQVKMGDGKEKLLTLYFSDKHFKVSTEQLNIGDGKEKCLTLSSFNHELVYFSTEQVKISDGKEKFLTLLSFSDEYLKFITKQPEHASAWLEHLLKAVPDWNNKNKKGADKNTVLAIKEYKRRFKLLKGQIGVLLKDIGVSRKEFLKDAGDDFANEGADKKTVPEIKEYKPRLNLLKENKRRLKLLKEKHDRRGVLLKGADKKTVTEIKDVHKKACIELTELLTDTGGNFANEDSRNRSEHVIRRTMTNYRRIESRAYTETTSNDKECRTQLNAYVKITLEMLNIALEIVSSLLILHRNIFPEVIRMFLHFPTMEDNDSKEQKHQ
ncbi:uncharacterized protein LOC127853800 isoform X9 [Dreissena polymorpha]|uniref:uncharacterized protein LOC127853800 isoform X8 n=1 Tax=Dreissena polymorpha TaxID=45954 RepID=UPI002263FD06|nr:uncharacterized protein LOC127853800 isoform X8 [Dreissena polymorpha]XP_052244539.1 uncharacterized protein LOC127853800 isoform X9 [Dreissena polymorpha]